MMNWTKFYLSQGLISGEYQVWIDMPTFAKYMAGHLPMNVTAEHEMLRLFHAFKNAAAISSDDGSGFIDFKHDYWHLAEMPGATAATWIKFQWQCRAFYATGTMRVLTFVEFPKYDTKLHEVKS